MLLNFNGPTDTYLFFFDTETTGLPRRWGAPLRDLDNWPRMVQLAWILCDEAGNEMASANRIILPQGYLIPREASRVHGITTERALKEGIPLADALDEALPQLEKAASVVAHNISFDEKIFGAECLRLNRPFPFEKKAMRCTMKESTNYCGLPGRYGQCKYPNLTELHRKLFQKAFQDAHDALADVRACKTAFFELRTRGIMA
ncbi:MAG: 3'-5' exonuclease [Lentisphaerae bacterium]|nr:3'-5' exonuclease [Lentisphaerota bacterium]